MRNQTPLVALLATSVIALAGCGQKSEDTTAHAEQPATSTSTSDANGTAAQPTGGAIDANASGTVYDANANGTAYGSTTTTADTAGTAVPPDNTGINKRDRDDANPTAGDQSHSPADLDLVRRIRESIEADDSLSANGKNVKVITRDGNVTLRGPVKDENERKSIGDKAAKIAGAGRVENQLEVAR